jgi:polyisoprenoid-binding protein YceI
VPLLPRCGARARAFIAAGVRLLPAGLLALAAATAATAARAEPVIYVLDPEHSFVHFEVLHFGTSTSRGRFGPLSGEVVLDRSRRQGEVALRIAPATVDTGFAFFNSRLRQADLLASTEFPEAYFVARNFRFDGPAVAEVRGEFTFRGTSQPLSLHARSFGCRDDAGTEVCGGDFEGEVLRSDFGATFGLPFIANRVRLIVQVEGRRVR